ncbi:MAG TPA: serine hydrolase [Phototrophicaceae bacterium]|nr:serine hydrolase [Phototrophicaceae bacterium]
MSVSGLGTKRRRRSLPVVQLISVMMLLVAIGLFVLELVQFSQEQERLPPDVTIAGIPVGGLLPTDAVALLERAYSQPVILYYAGSPIALDPAAVGFRTNRETMLAAAQAAGDVEAGFWSQFVNYLIGRQSQETVAVPLAADYQRGLLEQFLRDVAARYDRPSGDAGYNLETLTTRAGSEGYVLNLQSALPVVEAALFSPDNRSVNLPVTGSSANVGNIDTLRDMIIAYLNTEGFIYDGQTTVASVFILDLVTGEEVNILGDVAFSAASTMKVAILIDYFRHLWFSVPSDEAWLMANSLLCSNNSSSNLLMQIIGERVSGQADIFAGIGDVTNNAQYLGARNTYITAPYDLGIAGQQLGSISAPQTSPNASYSTSPDPYNQTTAEDMGTLFNLIYDCAKYGSGLIAAFPEGEYNQTECRQMLELMSANDLLRLLQGGIPAGTRISHKNGWVSDSTGDAGIVFSPNGRDYVIAVYLWEKTDFQDYTRLWPLVEGISRAAWNYFNPDEPLITARTDIPDTAQECAKFLPPQDQLDLNNINGWRGTPTPP